VLDPTHWPDMPSAHRAFLEAAIPRLRDERLVGLAAGGSFISRTLDEHSDLDLVVVSRPEVSGEVLRDGPDIARRLGPLLATFPGDHAIERDEEPRLTHTGGGQPNGIRRVEQAAPGRVAALRSTLASHDRPSCWRALIATLTL